MKFFAFFLVFFVFMFTANARGLWDKNERKSSGEHSYHLSQMGKNGQNGGRLDDGLQAYPVTKDQGGEGRHHQNVNSNEGNNGRRQHSGEKNSRQSSQTDSNSSEGDSHEPRQMNVNRKTNEIYKKAQKSNTWMETQRNNQEPKETRRVSHHDNSQNNQHSDSQNSSQNNSQNNSRRNSRNNSGENNGNQYDNMDGRMRTGADANKYHNNQNKNNSGMRGMNNNKNNNNHGNNHGNGNNSNESNNAGEMRSYRGH